MPGMCPGPKANPVESNGPAIGNGVPPTEFKGGRKDATVWRGAEMSEDQKEAACRVLGRTEAFRCPSAPRRALSAGPGGP